jgi:hypothetical protein
MFRLFLRKKVLTGDGKRPKAARSDGPVPAPKQKNRRVFARYEVDHKHLTLMNEADILLVREISAKGFSTEVSQRGFARLTVGDVYDARIRYLGELYDLQARVAWKSARGTQDVGFEIVKSGRETMLFLKRLLRPIEIASSLAQVESSFMSEGQDGKTWFHGDEESDLYVWHDQETQALTAWQLAIGNDYVEWTAGAGIVTGLLQHQTGPGAMLGAALAGPTRKPDGHVDPKKRQLAVDVIMALQFPVRDHLLETLSA